MYCVREYNKKKFEDWTHTNNLLQVSLYYMKIEYQGFFFHFLNSYNLIKKKSAENTNNLL